MLTIVTGPPCSGKTTYIQEHAKSGDIIVDFDAIAQALGSPVAHGHTGHIWKVAIEARDTAIEVAVSQHRKGATAWIIDSKPTAATRRRYTQQGARIIDLTATAEELHARAYAAGRPDDWHRRIDRFTSGNDVVLQQRTRW
jgi:predicted kinase